MIHIGSATSYRLTKIRVNFLFFFTVIECIKNMLIENNFTSGYLNCMNLLKIDFKNNFFNDTIYCKLIWYSLQKHNQSWNLGFTKVKSISSYTVVIGISDIYREWICLQNTLNFVILTNWVCCLYEVLSLNLVDKFQ